jgi:uncharacterized lipoprotein YmbA
MRPPGSPKGEYRRAQHAGTPVNTAPTTRAAPRFCLLALLCGVVLLSACSSRPPPNLLSLPLSPAPSATPATPAAAVTAGASSTLLRAEEVRVLVVRRVALPEYLLSRRVRYRADASTLVEWPDTVWAERIEVAASRELLAGLRQALPGWTVCEPGCAGNLPGAQVVSLRVELASMDFVRSTGRLQSQALLTLETAGQPTRQVSLDREIAARADSPQAHAQAIAELLQGLGKTVGEELNQSPR